MKSFGEKIRELRTDKGIPLRVVSAFLDIDPAILSKLERGLKRATRDQVVKLSEYFRVDAKDLLIAWLADKLVVEVRDEDIAMEALKVAEEEIAYKEFKKVDRQQLLEQIKEGIGKFPRVSKAWIYGSFAREDDGPHSDIDIAIETSGDFSYFDLAEVQHQLEVKVNRKIDVGFIHAFKPYIFEHIKPDLKLVYEK